MVTTQARIVGAFPWRYTETFFAGRFRVELRLHGMAENDVQAFALELFINEPRNGVLMPTSLHHFFATFSAEHRRQSAMVQLGLLRRRARQWAAAALKRAAAEMIECKPPTVGA